MTSGAGRRSNEPPGPSSGPGGEAAADGLRRARIAEQRLADAASAYQALARELDAHRARTTRRIDEEHERRRRRFLLAASGIVDGLDRAIEAARTSQTHQAIVEGLVLVRGQLAQILKNEGLERIPVLGLPPDASTSRMVGKLPVADPAQHGLVVRQLAPGHRFGSEIVELAKVIVGEYAAPTAVVAPSAGPGLGPPAQAVAEAATAVAEEVPAVPAVQVSEPPAEAAEPEPRAEPAAAAIETESAADAVETAVGEPAREPESVPAAETVAAQAALAEVEAVAALPAAEVSEVPREEAAPEAAAEASEPAPPAEGRETAAVGAEARAGVEMAAAAPEPVAGNLADSGAAPGAPSDGAATAEPSPPRPQLELATSVAPALPRRAATSLRAAAAVLAVAALAAAVRLLIPSGLPPTGGPSPDARAAPARRERVAPAASAAPAERQAEPAEASPFATASPPPVKAAPASSPAFPPAAPAPRVAAEPRTGEIEAPRVVAEAAPAGPASDRPRPSPMPPAPEPSPPQPSDLLAMADAALHEGRVDDAVRLFDEVLRMEPGSDRAREGKASASRRRELTRRSFVSSGTQVRTGEAGRNPAGFEAEGLRVLKTPRSSGRISFEVSPRSPQPGESVSWQAYITNDGRRRIRIASVTVRRTRNGAAAGSSSQPDTDLAPGDRMLVDEGSEVWQAETSSWSIEVTIVTHAKETFESRLLWE